MSLTTLNLKEAADFLQMSPSALRAKAKAGHIAGAKIGKCWVFIQSDLAAHIRSQYASPRQALRVQPMEKSLCYTNATQCGGSDLRPPTEREYDALLTRATRLRPKSSTTTWSLSIGGSQALGKGPIIHGKRRWFAGATRPATKLLANLRWVDQFTHEATLSQVDRDLIDRMMQARLSGGVSNATVNRTLAMVRSILRKAEREWGWIDKAPYVRMLPEPKRRIRWLTPEEANRLLRCLPNHLETLARFSLATGLRKSNVTGLKWEQVDLVRRLAWIHADQAKAGHSISVPLNEDALRVVRSQIGKHEAYIFTYHGKPIQQANTKAWKRALKKPILRTFGGTTYDTLGPVGTSNKAHLWRCYKN